ncbi:MULTISPECIES: hypothetical protein [unclassified Burkholderia]|uniref:hypothetical protein n=1 Tax=unclassified Burkholderia TaxID=2613784 RepID=UPI001421764B|nr:MULTISPECIES: hypothetical protein [unclassified Burkholderia]NIE81928.1 hypothetical protein [Burkholderia sp. Tr-860]NIF61772.1 hypothetical protein [Burkholderia sp. Cy-647]NIF94019.1 hypothetical protein [Burkholderia sp. Ax-1720]
MAFSSKQAVDILKAFGFGGGSAIFELSPSNNGQGFVQARVPVAMHGYMHDVTATPFVRVSRSLPNRGKTSIPVGSEHRFETPGALEAHLAATVHAIRQVNEHHLKCHACGGWLKVALANDRQPRSRFECYRPFGSAVVQSGRHGCPRLQHRELPVVIRYGSDSLAPQYTELESAAKRALMNKVWRALVDAVQQPALSVLPADYPAWHPMPADCHLNARRWCASYADFTIMRGWLHEPFADNPHRFVAHTIVQSRDGAFRDVTLGQKDARLRFVEHPTDDVDFDRLVHAAPHRVTELSAANASEAIA